MNIRTSMFVVAVAAVAFVRPEPAVAWDSICYPFQDPDAPSDELTSAAISGGRGCEGIEAARARWRDPVHREDEHRLLFGIAARAAGLPASVEDTQTLSVMTSGAAVIWGKLTMQGEWVPHQSPTVAPIGDHGGLSGYSNTFAAAQRSFAIDEMAQLPDFSYGLWDWASGNEGCPIQGLSGRLASPQQCHTFKTHMGAANANHFPPQSDLWYAHYHQLAIDAARACVASRKTVLARAVAGFADVAVVEARFAETWKACEVEALVHEAVAQHFLQDSFSAGHMWERWGATDVSLTPLPDLPQDSATLLFRRNNPAVQQMLVAEAVAAISGTIHGSDPPFFDGALGAGRTETLHDPMCYPDPSVRAWLPNTPEHVVGDLHAHDVFPPQSGYSEMPEHDDISTCLTCSFPSSMNLDRQRSEILRCTAGSLRVVYDALAAPADPAAGTPAIVPVLGAPTGPYDANDFSVESCKAPRVTNMAFFRGLRTRTYNVLEVAGELFPKAYFAKAASDAVVWLVGPQLASLAPMPTSLRYTAARDYTRLLSLAPMVARESPDGTALANLTLPTGPSGELRPFEMLGVKPNRYYALEPSSDVPRPLPVDYVDPPRSTPAHEGDWPDELHSWSVSRAFHRARAPERCQLDDLTAQIVQGPQRLIHMRARLMQQARGLQSRPADWEAQCEACAQSIAPFVWNQLALSSATSPAERNGPLCAFMPGYRGYYRLEEQDGTRRVFVGESELTDGYARADEHLSGMSAYLMADDPSAYTDDPVGLLTQHLGSDPPGHEALARQMCCAPRLTSRRDASGAMLPGTGGFRVYTWIDQLPYSDPVDIGMFLWPEAAETLWADSPTGGDGLALFEQTPSGVELRGQDPEDPFIVRWGGTGFGGAGYGGVAEVPNNAALHRVVRFSGPSHVLDFNNPSVGRFPVSASGRYVLGLRSPAGAPIQCTFTAACWDETVCQVTADGDALLTLTPQAPELWNTEVTFTASCTQPPG